MQLSYTDATALQHSRGGKIGAPTGQTILKSKWKVSEHTNDAINYRAESIDNHEITLQFYKFSKLSVQDSGNNTNRLTMDEYEHDDCYARATV